MSWPSYPAYKESDVEWLGEIPHEWSTSRLKYFTSSMAGGTPDTENPSYWSEDGSGIPWVAIGDMSRSDEVWTTTKSVSQAGRASKSLRVGCPGTVLFAMYASVGEVSVLRVPAVWNQALLGLRADERLCTGRFLFYCLRTVTDRLPSLYRSNTQNNLNADQVANLAFSLPSLDEQRAITSFLDYETAKIDALISKQEYLIATLQENRSTTVDLVLEHHGFTAPRSLADLESATPPKGWRIIRLGGLLRQLTNGFVGPTRDILVDDGVPYIQGGTHIKQGRIEFDRRPFYVRREWHDERPPDPPS